MSKNSKAAAPGRARKAPLPTANPAYEIEEDEYRAAEWSYDPMAYDASAQDAMMLAEPDEDSGPAVAREDRNGREAGSTDLPESGREGASQIPASKMAPRPNLRMAGRRPEDGPKDTEGKILEISAQLQELLEQRKEEAGVGFAASAALAKRTGFKPAGSNSTGSRLPAAPPISLPMRAHRPQKGTGWPGLGRPRVQWKRSLFLTLLAAAIAAGAYFAGTMSGPVQKVVAPEKGRPSAVQPPSGLEASSWSDANMKILDQALAADRSGDLNGAYKAMTDVSVKAKSAAGLGGYLANLELRRGNGTDAEGLISGSPDFGSPEGLQQMGFLMTRGRDFDKATDWLSRAVAAQPFNAGAFYQLGEALRRKGNFSEAIRRLDEALLRIPQEPEYSELRELTTFKMRLAKLEGGRRQEVAAELEAQMKLPATTGYWALTAASITLQDGDIAQASNWLAQAKTALGAERLDNLLGDYFFRTFSDRAEIASFFASAEAARQRRAASPTAFFVDP